MAQTKSDGGWGAKISAFAQRHLGVVVFILISVGCIILASPLAGAPPAESHTLLALEHGARFQLWQPFEMGHMFGPRYAAYYTFIIQNKIFGLWLPPYFVFNAVSVGAALAMAFALFRQLTASTWIALIAVLLLSLFRPIWGQTYEWLTGRQGSLAVLFACWALFIAVAPTKLNRPLHSLAFGIVLLLAFFSKEFSLAAGCGLVVYLALSGRRKSHLHIIATTLALTLAFVLMRLTFLESGIEEDVLKCEDMFYFAEARRYCIGLNTLDPEHVRQIGYNVFAGVLNGVFPGIVTPLLPVSPISHNGEFNPQTITLSNWFVASFVLFSWVVAARKHFALFAMCATMVLANAVLLFAFFRGRNLGISDLAVALVIAIGAFYLARWGVAGVSRLLRMQDAARASAIAGISAALLAGALVVADFGVQRAEYIAVAERRRTPEVYCRQAHNFINRENRLNREYHTDPAIVRAIFERYGVAIEDCPAIE